MILTNNRPAWAHFRRYDMKAIEIGKIARTAEHKRMFERKGFKMTGETLVV